MTFNTLLCPHCRSSVFIRMFVLFCPPPGSLSTTGNAKLSLHQLRGLDREKLNLSALAGDDGWSQTESRLMVNKQNGALTEFVHFKPDNHNYNPPLLFPSVTRRRMGRNWKKLDTHRRRSKTVPSKKKNGTPRVPGVLAAVLRSTALKAWWKRRSTWLPIYHPWDRV